jgi:hypothetical protein
VKEQNQNKLMNGLFQWLSVIGKLKNKHLKEITFTIFLAFLLELSVGSLFGSIQLRGHFSRRGLQCCIFVTLLYVIQQSESYFAYGTANMKKSFKEKPRNIILRTFKKVNPWEEALLFHSLL